MIVNVKNILITLFFLISATIIKSADKNVKKGDAKEKGAKKEEVKKDGAKKEEAKDNEDKNAADALFGEKKIEGKKDKINEAEIKEALGIKEVEGPVIKKEDIDKYKQKVDIKGYEDALKGKKNDDEKPKGKVEQNIIPVDNKLKVKEKNGGCCCF